MKIEVTTQCFTIALPEKESVPGQDIPQKMDAEHYIREFAIFDDFQG